MAKDVRGDVFKGSALEHLLPIFGKADERLPLFGPRKHKQVILLGTLGVQEVENWETDRSDRCTFFAIAQAKAAALGVDFRPLQIGAFAAPAASQR